MAARERLGSEASDGSDGSHPRRFRGDDVLPPPVLVYHESARSIVFRDHIRRAADVQENDAEPGDADIHQNRNFAPSGREAEVSKELSSEMTEMSNLFGGAITGSPTANPTIDIQGFQPNIVPLPQLELQKKDEFTPLLDSDADHTLADWTEADKEVVRLLETQRAVVKTIKNSDWTSFIHRFMTAEPPRGRCPDVHNDVGPHDEFTFNSFVTSTSLLPRGGRKMRSYGNADNYTTGVVFGLPEYSTPEEETQALQETRTWSWPSGYSAKTEFNIDSYGNLINGREEALVPLPTLREYNEDYLTKKDYVIAGRLLEGGLNTVPYNEIFIRVGGRGRVANSKECATGEDAIDLEGTGRSLKTGVGLPMALFVRSASFGHLISLIRTRARLSHVWGEEHIHGIPLLYMSPHVGIRVLTEPLQRDLLKIASRNLNPFQNPVLAHKTTVDDTDNACLETKLEELIDLDEDVRQTLTPEECVRLAGGFGATDESIAQILKDAMIEDKAQQKERNVSHRLQDIVNEGLASAVRSGDYYTSRQLLILYTLVASEGHQMDMEEQNADVSGSDSDSDDSTARKKSPKAMLVKYQNDMTLATQNDHLTPPPPPPPLDTDRLRSATNSDGLLAVLGAAQVLRAMKDGSAKKRTEESFLAVEEWVEHGEQSVTFRLASWRDQRAAQDDLQIATDTNSSFMAFVSNKAITNRKKFASQLRQATEHTDFADMQFLKAIYAMVNKMHSPCLRLELLQYVLGLDNRYSIAHVKRSIELAATCMNIATTPQ